jgi:hypothetical protein
VVAAVENLIGIHSTREDSKFGFYFTSTGKKVR